MKGVLGTAIVLILLAAGYLFILHLGLLAIEKQGCEGLRDVEQYRELHCDEVTGVVR